MDQFQRSGREAVRKIEAERLARVDERQREMFAPFAMAAIQRGTANRKAKEKARAEEARAAQASHAGH